jgi:hypothetical protein
MYSYIHRKALSYLLAMEGIQNLSGRMLSGVWDLNLE